MTGTKKIDKLKWKKCYTCIFVIDNKWDCSDHGLDWLALEKENSTIRKKIVDYYELVCHQQLYKGKPLHKVMDIIKVCKVFIAYVNLAH